jgi:hypothetical protein
MAAGVSSGADATFAGGAPLAAVCPLAVWEEALCCLLLLLVPGAALWVPVSVLVLAVAGVAGWGWAPLAMWLCLLAASYVLPSRFSKDAVHSPAAALLLRYFSFKIVWNTRLDPKDRHILAAHPHGAFPIGNILSVQCRAGAAGRLPCCPSTGHHISVGASLP